MKSACARRRVSNGFEFRVAHARPRVKAAPDAYNQAGHPAHAGVGCERSPKVCLYRSSRTGQMPLERACRCASRWSSASCSARTSRREAAVLDTYCIHVLLSSCRHMLHQQKRGKCANKHIVDVFGDRRWVEGKCVRHGMGTYCRRGSISYNHAIITAWLCALLRCCTSMQTRNTLFIAMLLPCDSLLYPLLYPGARRCHGHITLLQL